MLKKPTGISLDLFVQISACSKGKISSAPKARKRLVLLWGRVGAREREREEEEEEEEGGRRRNAAEISCCAAAAAVAAGRLRVAGFSWCSCG